jgi:hypothetical protein
MRAPLPAATASASTSGSSRMSKESSSPRAASRRALRLPAATREACAKSSRVTPQSLLGGRRLSGSKNVVCFRARVLRRGSLVPPPPPLSIPLSLSLTSFGG